MSKNQNVFGARKGHLGQSVSQQLANKKVGKTVITPDSIWDDIELCYKECVALSTQPTAVLPLMRNEKFIEQLDNRKEFIADAGILAKDVKEYFARLTAIHDKHVGKTGPAQTPDDLMTALMISEEYNNWLESYQTVVMPTTVKMLALFNEMNAKVPDVTPAQ